MIIDNVNTKKYWERRFSSGDWEQKRGRAQTAHFASSQVAHFKFSRNFNGSLVDFGCGLGDAMPVYKKYFPNVNLVGIDVSESAISKCKERYGKIATFISGTHQNCPSVDIIVASNVFEHLSDDIEIAKVLLSKCKELYITVPYKEYPLCSEHVRTYDEKYFQVLGESEFVIFPSRGWSEHGRSMWKLFFKNLLRKLSGRPMQPRRMQIMFTFQGECSGY